MVSTICSPITMMTNAAQRSARWLRSTGRRRPRRAANRGMSTSNTMATPQTTSRRVGGSKVETSQAAPTAENPAA